MKITRKKLKEILLDHCHRNEMLRMLVNAFSDEELVDLILTRSNEQLNRAFEIINWKFEINAD